MSNYRPNNAFILAAGKGTRLRPYTDTMPKPLVPVNGRAILDYTIEKLVKDRVNNITINLNYLGDRIKKHLKNRNNININFSTESELLDTGGGVKKALRTMNNQPFYLINGDALWEDKNPKNSTLTQLANMWDPAKMDILLLLQPVNTMDLTKGVGDYNISNDGVAIRCKNKQGEYMFTGVRIVNPAIFNNTPDKEFSFLTLMDKAEKQGRLHALIHDGVWHHISTPKDLDNVNYAMRTPQKIKA